MMISENMSDFTLNLRGTCMENLVKLISGIPREINIPLEVTILEIEKYYDRGAYLPVSAKSTIRVADRKVRNYFAGVHDVAKLLVYNAN